MAPVASGDDKIPPQDRNPSVYRLCNFNTSVAKEVIPRPIPPCTLWKPQTHHRVISDWLGFAGRAKVQGCLSRRRRNLDAPGQDNSPSPVRKPFNASTTPTPPGYDRLSPGSMPPRTVGTSHHRRLIAVSLPPMEPVRVECCRSEQRRGPTAPGQDNFPSSDHKSFHANHASAAWTPR